MTFAYDKRDLDFALFKGLPFQNLLSFSKYNEYTDELCKMVINEGHRFAAEKLWPQFDVADKEGVTLKDGNVRVPECYESIFKDFCENGWYAPHLNPEYGGQGLPITIGMALSELFVAANPSFMFTPGLGTAAGHLIENFGNDEQKQKYVQNMYTGVWGGTMCLTEPGAGSAVGDLKSTAEHVEGEEYKIVGNKIFISAGDHQLTDNIVHLVLARVKGDPAGIKGISLFIVPKFIPNDDGSNGAFNDVRVTAIEHKMGIHASPTCALSFGDDGECRGWLIGERCNGIRYMFQMMNEARLTTGLQGSAIGNGAYSLALDYAKERKQGANLVSGNPESVEIIQHPDVRRNLSLMKAQGEAIRGMILKASYLIDVAHFADDEEERVRAQDMLDLLTPICKAFPTDVGFKNTEIAMQVFGGYGYIREYKVEQYMRDVKIASIYEGTNGIQALDLLGRNMRQKGGALFMTWLQDVNEFVEKGQGYAEIKTAVDELDAAKNALGEVAFGFQTQGKKNPEYPLLHATPFLRMFGLVEGANVLLTQATVALDELKAIWDANDIDVSDAAARATLQESNEDARFYENKVKTAKFYTFQILPEIKGILRSIQSEDTSALDINF